MTDITDQDRRDMRDWARGMRHNPDSLPGGLSKKIADHILDTVEAPTLSEDLTNIAEHWETWTTPAITAALTAATSRAEQMEHDLADRVEAVEKENKGLAYDCKVLKAKYKTASKERDEARAEVVRGREIIRKHKEKTDRATGERDEALAIIETADWRHWFRDNQNLIAEVERLTAERDRITSGRHITYAEVDGKPVQKGAESNAEILDPDDVKPGEAWLVRDEQELSVAVRDSERWVLIRLDDATIRYRRIQHITLVSRLTPAPRVIDNPDELAEIRGFAIGMTARTDEVWQPGLYGWHSPNRTGKFSSKDIIERFGPMTILHDPEAE